MVDNVALRREVERELRTIREAIEGCEEEIARHETLDLPAFRQWMAVQCSDLLDERRLMEEKIWGLRARLAAIQGSDATWDQAYRRQHFSGFRRLNRIERLFLLMFGVHGRK